MDEMNEIDRLRQYAARTQPSAMPTIDVTADVMATLRTRRREPEVAMSRMVFTAIAASWLVAIGIGFYAQQSLSDVQDPMNSLIVPFAVTLE